MLDHALQRIQADSQNGSGERGFGTLKYEWLYRHEIDDALALAEQLAAYRHDYNTVRPHEAIAWNRPLEVHLGLADPTIPNLGREEFLPTTWRGTIFVGSIALC